MFVAENMVHLVEHFENGRAVVIERENRDRQKNDSEFTHCPYSLLVNLAVANVANVVGETIIGIVCPMCIPIGLQLATRVFERIRIADSLFAVARYVAHPDNVERHSVASTSTTRCEIAKLYACVRSIESNS